MKRALLAFVLGAAALASPSLARADEPAVVERFPPTSVRYKLIAGGAALTIVAWGAEFLLANQFSDVPGASAQKVPVVGPWIALGQGGCTPPVPDANGVLPPQEDCSGILALRSIGHVIDGLVQLGGLGLITEGLVMTTEAERGPRRPAFTVRPQPIVSARMSGIGLVGTF